VELTVVAGSLAAARDVLGSGEVALASGADVVVVPTAAAFTGAAEAVLAVAEAISDLGARVEGVMVGDRASSREPYFAGRVAAADAVVLTDGSALHARMVWRDTPVGAAIDGASLLVAIGSVASVLGEVMIDPRGGAPTVGLGYRAGPVFCVGAPEEQLARTRALLGASSTLVVLGPAGVAVGTGGAWRLARPDAVVTRGDAAATL
jgi:hypothetical protein